MENISITTDRTLDFHDLDRLAKGIIQPGMTSEQKALACYQVVQQKMFHYPWVYNVKERREEWHDATKLLNTYGHGLCGVQARTLGALYQKVFGYENQRLIGLNECAPGDWKLERDPGAFVFSTMQGGYSPQNCSGHTCVEVFYDDHWHHLDPMVEFYCYTRDGSRIASLQETIDDPLLVTKPSREVVGLMPEGDLSRVFYKSKFADWTPGPGYFMVMDTVMDIALEPGQSVTWFWDQTHKRFFWPDIWAERFTQPYFDVGPRHPNKYQSDWRHYGNGTFVTVKKNIAAKYTLAFSFPYVLVGGVIRFEKVADSGQVVLTCAKEDVCEWVVDLKAGVKEICLDEWIVGGYDLAICPRSIDLENVHVELLFQHNFIVSPQLLAGENMVSIQGQGDGDRLDVLWEWAEGDGQVQQDVRSVTPPDAYVIDAGNVSNGCNPKYMKRLQVSA